MKWQSKKSGKYDCQIFLIMLILSAWCFIMLQSCRVKEKENIQIQKKSELHDINEVMDAHAKEWMSIPGVVGCYVTISENGDSCIVIMAVKKTTEITKNIPKTIEGYPVEIVESGEIKPLEQ
jgi:hypothetical protein